MLRRSFLLLLATSGPLRAASAAAPLRVVALGGNVTEIVDALQAVDLLVGVDASSLHPASVRRLPQVGYYRSFAVEGVIGLRPDLVLASEHAGPPRSLEQLRSVGLRVVGVPSGPSLDALREGIDAVAQALGVADRGRALMRRIDAEIAPLRRDAGPAAGPRTLVLSSHTGKLQAAGRETAADALLALAGARNLFGAYSGFKAISNEAVAALAPEVIVTTAMSIAGSNGLAGFSAQPGVAVTPAARNGRVVVLDDLLLLAVGPRIGLALRQLEAGLDPQRAQDGTVDRAGGRS